MYKLKKFIPVNNENYNPHKKMKHFKSRVYNTDFRIVNYTINDESMEPEIQIGQSVVLLKDINVFNEKDIFLVLTPYCEMIRRVRKISDESVELIPSNIKCENEIFLADDVKILGKVKVV